MQYLAVVNGVGLICAPGMILKQYLNILQVRSHVSVSLSVSLSLHISDLSLARARSLSVIGQLLTGCRRIVQFDVTNRAALRAEAREAAAKSK